MANAVSPHRVSEVKLAPSTSGAEKNALFRVSVLPLTRSSRSLAVESSKVPGSSCTVRFMANLVLPDA
eukprot:6213925-Pleurochrysis_carterae.AAC.2